jgi:putative membrane protein
MSEDMRKPTAFILDTEPEAPKKRRAPRAVVGIEIETLPEDTGLVAVPPSAIERSTPKRFKWAGVFFSALLFLVTLWAADAALALIEDLFSRSIYLGYAATIAASLAGLAAIAIILREILGLMRLRRIEHIQSKAAHAINFDDKAAAEEAAANLRSLYASRADCAYGLTQLASHDHEIIDPRNRIRLSERHLLTPLDEEAHRIVARAARRVTLLTTVTPAAALDILFVAAQNIRMLRELASLYGGRPSTLSTWRLARLVIAHLAVAGGLALSDTLLQHLLGKGLLGRLSARFGEGAVNGILTARIGLAAKAVCRPVPLEGDARETLGSLMRELVSFEEGKDVTESKSQS